MNYTIPSQIPLPDKRTELKEQALRDVGKSAAMIRVIIGLSIVAVFYIVLLVYFLLVRTQITSDPNLFNSSYGYIMISLTQAMDIVTVALIVTLIARLVPLIGCILLYKKSNRGETASALCSAMTFLQVFGVIETIAWTAMIVYEIVMVFKNSFTIPPHAGSTYYMILVISVLIMICKLLQGIFLTKFITQLKRSVRQENIIDQVPAALKFPTVMIATCHAILLIFIVINLLITLGLTNFFKTFQYLWVIYLFLIGYILSNYFLTSLLNLFRLKMYLSSAATTPNIPNPYTPTPTPFQNYSQSPYQNTYQNYRPNNTPPYPNNQQPYQNSYQNYQPNNTPPYPNNQQPYQNSYQNYQPNNKTQYPNSQQPYQNSYQNDQPNNKTQYPNSQQSYQNDQPNNPFENMFGFNTHQDHH